MQHLKKWFLTTCNLHKISQHCAISYTSEESIFSKTIYLYAIMLNKPAFIDWHNYTIINKKIKP